MTTTQFGEVHVQAIDAVALIVFSRPPNNFFDRDLLHDIANACAYADEQPEIRAIVLGSEGKSFSAGATLGEGKIDPRPIYHEGMRLFRVSKPLVAAVQGAAVGGGLGLALVADFRVASPESRFVANFVKIGIHPGFGITQTLPRLVGNRQATLLLLTGRRVGGEEALKIGLCDILVSAEEVRIAALTLAAELAEGAPLAVQSTRATLRAGLADAIEAQLQIETREQIRLFDSEDFQEGIRAVTERRPGRWSGR